MKKLLLLIAASSIGCSAFAQVNNHALMTSSKIELPDVSANRVANPQELYSKLPGWGQSSGARNKSTTLRSQNHSEWFDYYDAAGGTSATLYYWSVAQDSNIYENAGTGTPYNIYFYGLGNSFDPSDQMYYQIYGASGNGLLEQVPLPDNIGYQIDSFRVPYKYYRHDNSTTAADSLIIEIMGSVNTSAPDSGTYKLRFGPSAADLIFSDDSVARFALPLYTRQISALGPNTTWDSIKTQKQRYAFPLVLADTAGSHYANFALTTPMNIPPKGKAISYVHFKSSFATTLGSASGGSTAANSNYLHLFAGTAASSSTAWPKQTAHNAPGVNAGYGGSYQSGLCSYTSIRYSDTGFTYMGHNMLMPGQAFNGPGLSSPTQAFHVKWTNMEEDAVANVNANINSVKAFPNPATDKVIVSFDLKNDANVTVTLTNMVGQVVASQSVDNAGYGSVSFKTTELPSGVYFYTVVANGQRSTGNVAIAH